MERRAVLKGMVASGIVAACSRLPLGLATSYAALACAGRSLLLVDDHRESADFAAGAASCLPARSETVSLDHSWRSLTALVGASRARNMLGLVSDDKGVVLCELLRSRGARFVGLGQHFIGRERASHALMVEDHELDNALASALAERRWAARMGELLAGALLARAPAASAATVQRFRTQVIAHPPLSLTSFAVQL